MAGEQGDAAKREGLFHEKTVYYVVGAKVRYLQKRSEVIFYPNRPYFCS